MFQQEAESEGVQQHPSNLGGSAHQPPEIELEILSGGVQPNVNPGGSAHQQQFTEAQIAHNEIEPEIKLESEPKIEPESEPDWLSLPESKPEIMSGGVQPNVNPGGSAHHPQLTETQIAHNESESEIEPESEHESEPEIWTAEHLNYYRPLYKAAQSGDWETAKRFIEDVPNALTAKISIHLGTVLHIAARSWQWKFIRMLLRLDVLTPQSIEVKNEEGYTALHFVAEGGSLTTAKALLEKNTNLLQIVNNEGYLPLVSAISSKNKELVWYLSKKTRVESPSPPFFIGELPMILRNLIQAGYYDIALYFVQRFPVLALAKEDRESLLDWLADNPSYFFSGCNLGFFEKWIYKFVRTEIAEIQSAYSLATQVVRAGIQSAAWTRFWTRFFAIPTLALQSITQAFRAFVNGTIRGWFKRLLWKAVTQLAPSIKIVRDAKMTHECAIQLVNHVVNQIELSTMSFSQIHDFLQNPASIESGIEEIVRTLVIHFPDLMFMWARRQPNILQVAIACRQENIVNIIKENSPITIIALCSTVLENGTALHLAAKLAPASKLFSVSGAALQMQREWQWFKEVEMYTPPDMIGRKDSEGQTAKDAFRLAHKELCKDGEKWMKGTAKCCLLVSTFIATVLFAAAYTVPGGNVSDKGIPIFLRSKKFTIFVISNALGLFSSLTSLLMFLAILAARYEIEDFLESLPRKLIIGLGSLFFAIAAMITAFGAALTIILDERWHWVSVPITLLASFPVAMFVMLELPLFVQMVQSTYGASIFRPLPSRV